MPEQSPREVKKLYHETSIGCAKNIIMQRMLSGKMGSRFSLENYPHFSISRTDIGTNDLDVDNDITLIFETDFPIQKELNIVPKNGYELNKIILFDRMIVTEGVDEPKGHWQAVIAPGSHPITLIEYELNDYEIKTREKKYFDRACKKKLLIHPVFFHSRKDWNKRNRSAVRRLLSFCKNALNQP